MQSTRYSCHTLMKPEFSEHIFGKTSNIKNFIKTRPLESDFLHADRRTDTTDCQDITNLIVAFRNSANTPQKLQ